MATTIVIEEQVEIPAGIDSLADFRRWATSDSFPQRGRIDYLSGRIEVDMSPEDLFCHGTLKGEIHAALHALVKQGSLGHLFVGQTRISSPKGDLSCEPDVLFVSHDAVKSERVKLVRKRGAEPGRFIEIEGPVELVVEVVSDSSVKKDTRRLPPAYFAAGVAEFWLADARRSRLVFQIHRRGQSGFEPAEPDAEGYQRSAVFARSFRLDRQRDAQGLWEYDLRVKE